MAKEDLVREAEALGVQVEEGDTIAQIKEKMEAHEEAARARESSLVDVAFLEENSQMLFGVPRSVFVGAKSAGMIVGDRVSKEDAAAGVQAFLEYEGGS